MDVLGKSTQGYD